MSSFCNSTVDPVDDCVVGYVPGIDSFSTAVFVSENGEKLIVDEYSKVINWFSEAVDSVRAVGRVDFTFGWSAIRDSFELDKVLVDEGSEDYFGVTDDWNYLFEDFDCPEDTTGIGLRDIILAANFAHGWIIKLVVPGHFWAFNGSDRDH